MPRIEMRGIDIAGTRGFKVFVLVGIGTLFACILVGYTMHHGKIAALIQINEFIIIGGAGFSSLLAATSPKVVTSIIKDVIGLLKPNPFGRTAHLELLQFLYDIATLARREGLLALEPHVERPDESDIVQRYSIFRGNHHAVAFFSDSTRLVTMGGVGVFEMQEMMEADIEVYTEETKKNSKLISMVGDAMPGFGICAAVLGVVITMQAINGPPEQIGEKVGAALVGTFLGVLLCYGVFQPLATAMEARAESAVKYISCLKCGILVFAQGLPPILVAEFARRNIEPEVRPSFQEMEDVVKKRGDATNATEKTQEAA